MPAKTGNYSRFIFDRAKQYVYPLIQQGKAVIDADLNDWFMTLHEYQKNLLHDLSAASFDTGVFANNPPGDGSFEIKESAANNQNNFYVGPGRGYLQGLPLTLDEEADDIEYLPDADSVGVTQGRKNLHSIVTAVDYSVSTEGKTTVKDSSMLWPNDAHNSRELVPDISDTSTSHTIEDTKNDNELIIDGDVSSSFTVGEPYLIKISTPGGVRTDQVWLNSYLDEVDSVEDPDLEHPIKGGYESCLRIKSRTIIEIEEDTGGSPVFDTDYVDDDGNQHYRVELAEITRNASAIIDDSSTLSDDRISITSTVHDLEDHPTATQGQANAIYAMRSPGTANHALCVSDGVMAQESRVAWGGGKVVDGVERDLFDRTILIYAGTHCVCFDTAMHLQVQHNDTYLSPTTQTFTDFANVLVGADIEIDPTTSGANGLDTGSMSANTWYVIYLIYNPTTSTAAGLISLSIGSPTLPSGYTLFRRIGHIRSNASTTNPWEYCEYVDGWIWYSNPQSVWSGTLTHSVVSTFSLEAAVPPYFAKFGSFVLERADATDIAGYVKVRDQGTTLGKDVSVLAGPYIGDMRHGEDSRIYICRVGESNTYWAAKSLDMYHYLAGTETEDFVFYVNGYSYSI